MASSLRFASSLSAFLICFLFLFNEANAQGNTCANAVVVNNIPYNTPFLSNPSTCGAGNNYTSLERCGNYYMDSEEFVYEFTPTAANSCITINLTPGVLFDVQTALFVTKGCPDDPNGSCIAQSANTDNQANTPKPTAITDLQLTPGETYYIQVSSRTECFDFSISITAGNCTPRPQGSDCDTAEEITTLPHRRTDTNCGGETYLNRGNNCTSTYHDGPQYIMKYTPDEDMCIKYSGRATDQTVRMSVHDTCPSYSDTTCIRSYYFYTFGERTYYSTLDSGVTYYFVISTTASINGCSAYDITFDFISSEGATCATAIPIDSMSYTHPFQSTACKVDDYNQTQVCNSWYVNGEDVVYTYESTGGECISVGIDGMNTYGGLYLLDKCPSDPLVNCLIYAERNSWNDPYNLSMDYTLDTAGTYYIIVGARSTFTSLEYNFSFISSKIDSIGVSCVTPHALPGAIPVSAPNLSTSCKVNDYLTSAGCSDELINGNDYVMTFTPDESFCGTVMGKNTFGKGGLMLMDGCPDNPATNCLGATGCEVNCDSIYLDYSFVAGQTYYIVAGAANGGTLFGFDLEIKKAYNTLDGCKPCRGQICEDCRNADFELGSFDSWSGAHGTGSFNNPVNTAQYMGLLNTYINAPMSRHTLMNVGSYDPVIGPALSTTGPFSDRYAVRLGNRDDGYEGEQISYTLTVTPANQNFFYYYAAVLEDPGSSHTEIQQPYFSVSMKDENGNSIPCSDYEVRTSNAEGFVETPNQLGGGIVLWKDWSLVAVPLQDYMGQTLTIDFIVKDCGQGGHFGYAYIDAFCTDVKIETSTGGLLCEGDTLSLYAPDGFKSYLWNTGATTQNITINAPGLYTVTAESFSGCSVDFEIDVKQAKFPTADFSVPTPICANDTFPFTDMSASLDTAQLVAWNWDFDDGNTSDEQNPVHDFPESGTYNVTLDVTTSTGCTSSITKAVDYSHIQLLVDSIGDPSCFYNQDGYIHTTADSGIAPYVYDLNLSGPQGSGQFSNLVGDEYFISVTDNIGCVDSTRITLVQPDTLLFDAIDLTHILCFGDSTGIIDATASGGTGLLSYTLDLTNYQDNGYFDGLPANNYTLTLSDSLSCFIDSSFALNQPDAPLAMTIEPDSVNCYGEDSGSLEAKVTGGVKPYLYSLDNLNFQPDSVFANLFAGPQTVYLTDSNLCVLEATTLVEQPDSLHATVQNITPSGCITPSGTFEVLPVGGIRPYVFQLNNNPPQNDSLFTGVASGNHAVRVIDDNNCTYTVDLIIPEHEAVVIKDVSENCDLASASYTVTVSLTDGDVSTYQVNEISPGVGGSWLNDSTWVSNPINSNIAYQFEFTDVNGCQPPVANGMVDCECKADAGSFNHSDTVFFCNKGNQSFVFNNDEFLESDENLTFIIYTDNNDPLNSILLESSTPSFNFDGLLTNQVYYLQAYAGEASGNSVNFNDVCLDGSNVVTFYIYPPLSLNASTNDQFVCPGGMVSIDVVVNGSSAPYSLSYTVNGTPDTDVFNGPNHTITIPVNGPTNVQFSQLDDRANSPCLLPLTDAFTFDVFPAIQVNNIQYSCNSTSTMYQVSFDISGGDPASYSVDGVASGTSFTSGWIANNTPHSFTVSDQNNCNPVVVNGSYGCPCLTDAGSLLPDTLAVCMNDLAVASHQSDEVLDGNDVLRFILHDSDNGLGSILAWNNTPEFSAAAGIIAGQTYYISAIAGNQSAGQVDLNDTCLSLKHFIPVTFHSQPTLNVDVPQKICMGDSAIINLTAQGSFGTYDVDYELNGVPQTMTIGNGTSSFGFVVSNDATLTILRIANSSNPLCSNPINQSFTIEASDKPAVGPLQFTCNTTATGYLVQFTISGGDSTTYMVNGVSSGANYTSAEIPSGNAYNFVITDGNNCNPIVLNNTYSCPCITQLGAFDTTTAFICENQVFSIPVPAAILDANDRLSYFTAATPTPGSTADIIEWLSGPQLSFNASYLSGTSYYCFAIAGDKVNTNEVDFSGSCTQISDPKPFTFLPMPTVTTPAEVELCFNEVLQLPLALQGANSYYLKYELNGTSYGGSLNHPTADTISLTVSNGDQIRLTELQGFGASTCISTLNQTIDIIMADSIRMDMTTLDPLCHDSNDGSITAQANGGFGNYLYEWQRNGNTINYGQTINNLGGDDYTVIVRDQHNCVGEKTATLIAPDPFVIDYLQVINENCYRDFTGFIYVNADGSVMNELSTPTNNTVDFDSIFVDLSFIEGENSYAITATNANGCEADTLIEITGLSPLLIDVTDVDETLCPGDPVKLGAQTSGGVGGYTYFWSTGATTDSISYTNTINTVLYITARDGNQCEVSDSIPLSYFKPLSLNVTHTALTVCPDDEISLSAQAFEGDFNYGYEWMVDGMVYSDSASISIRPEDQTQVSVQVSDGCQQTASEQLTLDTHELLSLSIEPEDPYHFCAEGEASFQLNGHQNALQSCLWAFSDGSEKRVCTDELIYPFSKVGEYDLRYTATDKNGCSYELNLEKAVAVTHQSNADFDIFPNQITDLDNQVQIIDESIFADEISWKINGTAWDFKPYMGIDRNMEEYIITQYTTTAYGCNDSITKAFPVKPVMRVFIPNSFSPNSDDINAVFKPVIYAADTEQYQFKVFDRWGELIFETNDPDAGWDGTYKGKMAPVGVYTYYVKVRNLDKTKIEPYHGTVNLLR